ncbi:L-xylulose 5-phosphate 3-epimerase [Streptococcus agalactiae LMG 14747]|uniref:L-xylulose 5-phosphate 3-epimerase n=1 Tax=Streptococcus agalactiae LMG 14747 TaxID=1154860 RepID=V6Z2V8_STRAG|nr:L-xylulose 5-phosphate 3-epimerase [Streptococcus agalactiae LMG 14747]
MSRPIGIYEKATPKQLTWVERLKFAKDLGFDFVEMSIDETDERLARLNWSTEERLSIVKVVFETGVRIPTICFSGHRRYPLGSNDPDLEKQSLILMKKCLKLAQDLGVRTIQLAGYDVYYEEKSVETRQRFLKNLRKACDWAEEAQVILAIEIMDDPFINSIEKYLAIEKEINSPYLFVYPVTETSKGQFRDVAFGEGCVDWEEMFSVIKNTGYNGPFLIEMWSENCKTIDETQKAIQEAQNFLYPIMTKVGVI